MEYIFSYGTLQKDNVQLDSFGRLLKGKKDVITGYKIKKIEIKDLTVINSSKEQFHPILIFSGDISDEVKGTVYEISSAELLKADDYEVDDYTRVEAILKSGKKSWVYISKSKII
tara:strand:+ start:436 stop:780 length:345 start_codon:yes stop_codon:yes gene_type:complete